MNSLFNSLRAPAIESHWGGLALSIPIIVLGTTVYTPKAYSLGQKGFVLRVTFVAEHSVIFLTGTLNLPESHCRFERLLGARFLVTRWRVIALSSMQSHKCCIGRLA